MAVDTAVVEPMEGEKMEGGKEEVEAPQERGLEHLVESKVVVATAEEVMEAVAMGKVYLVVVEPVGGVMAAVGAAMEVAAAAASAVVALAERVVWVGD